MDCLPLKTYKSWQSGNKRRKNHQQLAATVQSKPKKAICKYKTISQYYCEKYKDKHFKQETKFLLEKEIIG